MRYDRTQRPPVRRRTRAEIVDTIRAALVNHSMEKLCDVADERGGYPTEFQDAAAIVLLVRFGHPLDADDILHPMTQDRHAAEMGGYPF